MKHKSLVEWVSKPLSVTVGKQKIERASFQSRFPGEELFLKLGQVMGDGRADPSDRVSRTGSATSGGRSGSR